VALAHNGNIVNAESIREKLIKDGAIFQGTNDTEVVLHLLARHQSANIVTCLAEAAKQLEGAFSMVLLTKDSMLAMRDPYGFRPLVLGRRRLENGKYSLVLASETCAFDLIGAEYLRDIESLPLHFQKRQTWGKTLPIF
jgi:amidophosphoribosyltransferase